MGIGATAWTPETEEKVRNSRDDRKASTITMVRTQATCSRDACYNREDNNI
jgi:hypothetical protein